ncbi:Eisosome assembly protein [Conoideocrella luteorostrata]|uniref:Eisosome assembly protein n=1 Tax=Conoideocrella luteorostrata TaxID=1105319 RepID=A0AAJ0CS73_9HYPO|nr:Eisosome assembly protein [Conoideocrella luteorostrata]
MASAKTPAQQAPPSIQSNSGRIKYADPRSLPSFPSSGLAPDGAAASAAASLGWSNQKSVDLWKPDPSSSASAAAVLAKDYKMSPQWEPSAQSDGHKAALLAVGSAGAALKKSNTVSSTVKSRPSQDTWGNSAASQAFHANRPAAEEPLSMAHGSSAATQAFNVNRSQSLKKVERPRTPPGNKSLAAAKGAMNRPGSATAVKDIQASEAAAAANALNGATLAHRQSMKGKPGLEDVGAVSVTTMTRNMFTANPPVKPEVDERTYNEKIHQSAVEMAKKMYARQQIMVEQTKGAQAKESEAAQPNPYVNLQDAAYKQAQARLAKLHDEHHQSREFQEYYGKEKTSPKNRNSMINKLRRRGSDSDDSVGDQEQSAKIREQMSMFSSKLSRVDREKRDKDREVLLAAAQRNVKARLHGMDEKVYQETGRANPSLITDWESKAQKAAQTRHESRTENKGKIDIGGGMYMTQEEIDNIASKRIQPVLDDINDKAETERERQEVLKLEEQARREEAEKQKTRDREAKDIVKKTKEQEKQEQQAKKLQEKLDEKHRKDEEKAAKAEQKRLAKDEKRKSKLGPAAATAASDSHHDNEGEAIPTRDRESRPEAAEESVLADEHPTVDTNVEAAGPSQRKAEGSNSPTSKVKGWIKNRFSRGKSFGEQDRKRRSFFGGASLKDKDATGNGSAVSIENRSTSMHDVALAGKTDEERHGVVKTKTGAKGETRRDSAQHDADRDSQGVSPMSTPLEEERELGGKVDGEDTHETGAEDRQSRKTSIEPPRPIQDPVARTSSSPTRDSRFREEMDR